MQRVFTKYFLVFRQSKHVLYVNILDKLFSFVFFLLLARTFSSEEYGQAITLFTLSSVFMMIFDFGLPNFIQSEAARKELNTSGIFSEIFIINLLIPIVFLPLAFGYCKLFYPSVTTTLFFIVAVSIYSSQLVNICNKTLSGLQNFKSQFTAFWISRLFIMVFVLAGIYYLSFDMQSTLVVMLIGFAINFILIFYFVISNEIHFSFKGFSFNQIKVILGITYPLGLAVLFNFLYDKVDILVISKLLDFTKTAYYSVGYGLYKSSSLAFSFILLAGFTKVSLLSRNPKAVSLFFKKYACLILMITFPITVILFFLSSPIINLLYTNRFTDSILVVKILSFAVVGLGLNNLTGIILNGIGVFKVVTFVTLFGLIVNIILNILFVPYYGIKAAAVVTVVTEYLILGGEYYYLAKILKAGRQVGHI